MGTGLIVGIDDLRSLEPRQIEKKKSLKIYADDQSYSAIDRVFPYIVKRQNDVRKVSLVEFEIIEPMSLFNVCGLDVLPIPVIHGEDYRSLGEVVGCIYFRVYLWEC